MSTSPICPRCHKPYYDDGRYTSPQEICMGHLTPETNTIPIFIKTEELTAIAQPDYSLVLERIAIALEDIVTKLGYIGGVY